MRRTKRFASFALAACMGVSLLVNVPAGMVSAAEPRETITSPEEGAVEETVPGATGTDAEALDETQKVVYDESEADEDGFVWDGTTFVRYVGKGRDVKIPDTCTEIGMYAFVGCSGLNHMEIPQELTRKIMRKHMVILLKTAQVVQERIQAIKAMMVKIVISRKRQLMLQPLTAPTSSPMAGRIR